MLYEADKPKDTVDPENWMHILREDLSLCTGGSGSVIYIFRWWCLFFYEWLMIAVISDVEISAREESVRYTGIESFEIIVDFV